MDASHLPEEAIDSGHIFFDTNTLGEIHHRGVAPRIRASLAAAGLEVQPTALNLIEAYSASDGIADTVVATIRQLAGRVAALPRTDELLTLCAEAFLRGNSFEVMPLVEIDPELLANRELLRSKHLAYRDEANHRSQQKHAEARVRFRPLLKKMNLRPRWEEFPQFLETWPKMDVRAHLSAISWRDLKLPEPFPPEILDKSDAWRLMADADAIAIYQGALAFDQPKLVQRMDQLQLPYLGGAARRILVTRDGPFASTAKSVLHGRYHLARVMTLDEFLTASGIAE